MKNNNRFFQQFKQWGLKVSVSSIIFVSVVMLGGVIITLALPSSLDEVKSSNADQQLTAENWDYLVDQVKSTVNDITTLTTTTQTDVSGLSDRINALDGTVGTNTTNIADLSGKVSTNTTNISNLSGKLATLSGNVTTLLSSSSSSLRAKNGNNIYYTSGNVGVGIIPNTSYALSTISLYIPGDPPGRDTSYRNDGYTRIMPKDFQMVGYSYQYTGTISIAVDDGNYNGAHISVTNGTDGTRIAPTYIWVGKSGGPTKNGHSLYFVTHYDSLTDRSSCSSEGVIALANRNNDPNNSRLFVCEKVGGALKRVSLGGE